MNQPIDDKTLETYLKGDTQVSRQYRDLDAHEVPSDLDRRILAEAHSAAAKQAATKSRAWMRWSAPLALAASAVLVLSIVIETGVDQDATRTSAPKAPAVLESAPERAESAAASSDELLIEKDVPPPPSAASAPSAAPTVQSEEAQPASKSIEQLTVPEARQRAQPEPQQSVPAARAERPSSMEPSPAEPPMTFSAGEPAAPPPVASEARVAREPERTSIQSVDINEIAVTGSSASRREQRAAGPRDTVRADRADRADSFTREERAIGGAAMNDETRDPERWLEEIRELRRAGKVEEAEQQWREFREMFPEYEVAEGDVVRGEER